MMCGMSDEKKIRDREYVRNGLAQLYVPPHTMRTAV